MNSKIKNLGSKVFKLFFFCSQQRNVFLLQFLPPIHQQCVATCATNHSVDRLCFPKHWLDVKKWVGLLLEILLGCVIFYSLLKMEKREQTKKKENTK